MLSTPRKLLALYLAISTSLAPVLPAFASITQPLPELGSTNASQNAPSDAAASKPSPEWLLQAATNPDLAPRAVHHPSQGIEQAVAQGAGLLSGAASEATKNWFASKHITAEMALKIDHKGVHGGSLDVLLPFYNASRDLVFTQLGARRANTYTTDYRNTLNAGLGYRHTEAGWLLGVNSFYDRDVTGKNHRVGVGAEAWTDFLKLSANSYLPLSKWHASPDRTDYVERPAKGWDVRAEGYLPAHPQLGAKLTYEQYYGKAVSLFSADDRQKDPRAVTVGVMYNPVPMVGIDVSHRMGQGGLADTAANVSLNYRVGESLAKQLSSGNVMASRLLANLRYNLVNRNNELVMDNRKNTVQLQLPATLAVAENQTVQFPVIGASALNTLSWTGSASVYVQPYSGGELGWLTMPPAISTFGAQPQPDAHSHSLQAVGTDRSGRAVVSNVMTLQVYKVEMAVAATPAAIQANGTSTTTLSATVKGAEGQAVGTGLVVNWTTSAGTLLNTTSSTNAQGVATVQLTSPTQVGRATVEASSGSATASGAVTFTAGGPARGTVNVAATPSLLAADGTSISTLTTVLKDDHGNVTGEGVTVNWTTNLGTLSAPATDTDKDGKATVLLTSATKTGTAIVRALSGEAQGTASVTFTPGAPASGNEGLSLSSSQTALPADGTSTSTLTAQVKDSHGNPVAAGTTVSWGTSTGTLSSATSATDSSGETRVTLTSATLVGTATVTASAGAANNTATVTFSAGAPAPGANGITLGALPASITADGFSTTTLSATVKDAYGNTAPSGVKVAWSTTAGKLASSTSDTNTSGIATVVLTSPTTAGTATLQATAGAGSNTLPVSFTPGVPATGNDGITLTANPAALLADGASTTTLTATVRDAHGNAVAENVPVTWTTSAGSLAAGTSKTDSTGKATMVLTSASLAGLATVHANAANAHNSVAVTFKPGAPAAGRQGLMVSVLTAPGANTATLDATVKDVHGNPVGEGVAVSWKTNSGTLASATTTTNSAGVASVLLTNAGGPQQATVEATSGAASDSVSIAFHAGVPAVGSNGIDLDAAPDDGSHAITLTATVRDAYGDAVGADIDVNWQTSLGTLTSSSSRTNTNGVATMVITGAQGTGADVTASTGAANNTVHVSFTPGTPATGSNGVSLSAAPPSLPADGTSQTMLSATVRDAHGDPVGGGVAVSWNTDLGTLSAGSSTTNPAGVATAVLTSATTAGTATVTVISGTAHNAVPIIYLPGAPAAGSNGMRITASDTSIAADGTSTSTLIARVNDLHGNAVGEGIAVAWTTDAGTLSSPSTATDAKGETRVVLTSATRLTTATINATAGAASNAASVAFVAGPPADGSAGMNLVVLPASITADGSSTATLTATVRDAQGFAVGKDVAVTWTTSAGTLVNTSSATDASGIATVTLTSDTLAGTATVSAAAGAALAETTVTFTAGAPASMQVSAAPDAIVADGTDITTLTATVVDAFGNRVGANQSVSWTTTSGVLAITSSVTDDKGQATVVLTSPTSLGSATVEATAGEAKASTTVRFVPGAPASMVTTASPSSIPANGTSTTTIKAVVKDAQGNLVAANTTVTWTTSGGTLGSTSSVTDKDGAATVVLTSATAGGTNTVHAIAGAATGSVTVYFTGIVNAVAVSASPTTLPANGTSTSIISAAVTDIGGRPIGPGVTVVWAVSSPSLKGTLSAPSSVTNDSGIATVTLTSARDWTNNTISATVGSVTGSTVVTFALKITASSSVETLPKGSTATLTATFSTPDGTPLDGIEVEWFSSAPEAQLPTNTYKAYSTTNSQGVATMTVTNKTNPSWALMNMAVKVKARNSPGGAYFTMVSVQM